MGTHRYVGYGALVVVFHQVFKSVESAGKWIIIIHAWQMTDGLNYVIGTGHRILPGVRVDVFTGDLTRSFFLRKEEGSMQADPVSMLLFCLTSQHLINALFEELPLKFNA